ncbi:hypothetical protein NNJEOMEG_01843 [Fundidesulfovibrio magnetotacticus]|uniref:PNPLA domain-containing protein n=1 Tax=Fundidesulfovibrio magnetotacticus TaxID=2730080 RepID=A0A6V8M0K5_9BACT|nr:hypothetical protein [Fundidesulfovibrio magnetotacticus]GFK94005.1 hypothetical protein NNJEOMEG_01843 [Fundidesulfovibrio magnetotacticus]
MGNGGATNAAGAGVFELGLCMAGAISAGAYTAGVVDFLLEALNEWHEVKAAYVTNPDEPDPEKWNWRPDAPEQVLMHSVRLKALTGASAGGLTAAVVAASLMDQFAPVRRASPGDTAPTGNMLYDCWVLGPDILYFLDTKDLSGGLVRSALDCTWLTGFIRDNLTPRKGARRRPYLADPLHLFLAVSNMRGVPYTVKFAGGRVEGHEMMLHADYLQFVLGESRPDPDSALGENWLRLDPKEPRDWTWDAFRTAAQATSAIPLVLRYQTYAREYADYTVRKWDMVSSQRYDPVGKVKYFEKKEDQLIPHWDRLGWNTAPGYKYKTLLVDGGLMNNEPFELARRCVAGPDKFNPRDPREVRRAVLMVDPFPVVGGDANDDIDAYENKEIHWLAGKVITAVKMQARFKPEELQLAMDCDVYSRFLVAPSRVGPHADEAPIACGSLGGFGGFLSLKFRQHDFMLGRRNCQRFLEQHFCIPLGEARVNPLFAANHKHLENFVVHREAKGGGTEAVIPILPVLGRAQERAEMDGFAWETLAYERDKMPELLDKARARLKALAELYVSRAPMPGIGRWAVKWLLEKKVYDKVVAYGEEVLRKKLGDCGL